MPPSRLAGDGCSRAWPPSSFKAMGLHYSQYGSPAQAERPRSTDLPERSLEEVCQRTNVIGWLSGETSCLTMAWAGMDLVIAGGRGLGLTLPERHQIRAIVATGGPAGGPADRLTTRAEEPLASEFF